MLRWFGDDVKVGVPHAAQSGIFVLISSRATHADGADDLALRSLEDDATRCRVHLVVGIRHHRKHLSEAARVAVRSVLISERSRAALHADGRVSLAVCVLRDALLRASVHRLRYDDVAGLIDHMKRNGIKLVPPDAVDYLHRDLISLIHRKLRLVDCRRLFHGFRSGHIQL